ncbi:MAG: bifunctional diguanylate cyclase/phosphodiesterase [Pseudomonadota bacterium]
MAKANKPMRLTPIGLVVMPFAVLTFVVVLIVMVVIASDQLVVFSSASLLIAGLLLYASTVFILGRHGFSGVRELETMGTTDSLSLLPNRRELHASVEKLLDTGEEVAIAIVDLDGFKQINDHFGDVVGDTVIQRCSALLRDVMGQEGRCYRLSGDEFAIVFSGNVAGPILEGMCRTLLEQLDTPFVVDNHRILVGASIGLSRSNTDQITNSSELLRRADIAMEMSKRGGKMRCTWYNENFDERREAVREMEDDLRKGLATGEFELAYQPLVDADTQDIVAVEALLRWNREDGQQIGPNVFIPVAEQSGVINPIGLWVLRQAMYDALPWKSLALSVNISAAQLRNPEFPIKLGELLEETGFNPEQLELEVTETCLVLDPVIAERSLDIIRKFGVKVSLDDFGTGYASIGFLRQFRFEKLKLDRTLVVQAGQDEASRAMMLSSIALARALKMAVTAEGVETHDQAEMVRLAGCDQMQGWLYYKALPASDIDALVLDQVARNRIDLQQQLPQKSVNS